LAIRQDWIIFSKKVLDELVKPLGLCGLREKVGEDASKRIPRRSQALACQGVVQLEDGESIQETIFVQVLVPGIMLTNLPCWRKERFYQYRHNFSTKTQVKGQKER
jgi:hypothetical protein